jgi:hypothetical protein
MSAAEFRLPALPNPAMMLPNGAATNMMMRPAGAGVAIVLHPITPFVVMVHLVMLIGAAHLRHRRGGGDHQPKYCADR